MRLQLHTPGATPETRLLLLICMAALVGAAGCTTIRPPPRNPQTWPLPPDKPRVRFVRAFGSEDDLRAGFGMTLKRIFIPRDPRLVLRAPTYVALSPDERRLIVASGTSHQVLSFDLLTGSVDALATKEGARPSLPFAAVMDDTGNLYVSDSAQALVWVLDPSGNALMQIGKGVLTRPTGLAIDRRRQVLYVVNAPAPKEDGHAIEVFSLKGAHLRRIGSRGSGPGEFFVPSHAAVGRDGTLYVSDVLNARVQSFSPDGEVLGSVGQSGVGGPGLFRKVKGVAVDAFGSLHVVDSEASMIQMFNAQLRPLMAYGGSGQTLEHLLQFPTGIAIDSQNNIFVADYGSGRVVQYQIFDTQASETGSPLPPKGGADDYRQR